MASPLALAQGPTGGVVTGGQGTISRPNDSTTRIDQQSQRLALDWQQFNVAQGHTVQFNQPNAQATALNRIHDQNPSQIFGAIIANGNVFLVNPNGIVFGETASVNVNSLFATTLDVSPGDFMSGNWNFEQVEGANGMIVNRGLLAAARAGSVTLVAGAVVNEGVILADYGTVTLAGGTRTYVDFDGDGLLRFEVSGELQSNPGADSAVANHGTIQANGGQVLLTAQAVDAIFASAVNNGGIITANRVENVGGIVRLGGGANDTVVNNGSIDVSSPDGEGGRVELTGARVGLMDDSVIDASGATGGGQVYVGGGFQGNDPDLRNATVTYVAETATVNADATDNGDGGEVIIWADDTTRFFGTISARGGDNGGDGGFVEVSGKKHLQYAGLTDTRAPLGETGTLMLDPGDIRICALANCGADAIDPVGGDPFVYQPSIDTSILTTETLNTQLGLSDVLVTTNSGAGNGPNGGSITVEDIIASLGGNTLTLDAASFILVSAGITDTGGGSLVLNAGTTVTVNAAIALSGGVTPGSFTSSGTDFTTGAAGTITTAGGAVNLDGHTGAISLGAAVTTAGGAFTALNVASFDSTVTTLSTAGLTDGGAVDIAAAGAVAVGAITTTGSAGNGGAIGLDGGTVALHGNLTATGTGDGGAVTITGPATLFDTVVIDSQGTGTDGAVQFVDTIDSNTSAGHALTVNAGAAAVTFGGAIGQTVDGALGSLAVNTTGAISLGGSVTTVGTQTYGGPVTLNAAGITLTTTNSAIGFTGTVTGGGAGFGLSADAGSALISLGDNVTLTDAALSLTAVELQGPITLSTGTGEIIVGAVTATAPGFDLVVANSGNATFNDTVNIGGGAFDLTGVTGGTVTVTGTFTGGSISTGTGDYDLMFQGGGTVTGPSETVFAHRGNLSIGASFAFTSGVSSSGPPGTGGPVQIDITGDATITTGGSGPNNNIDFSLTPIVIADGVTLQLGNGENSTVSLGAVAGANGGAASHLIINTLGIATLGGTVGTNIGSVAVTAADLTVAQAVSATGTITITAAAGGALSVGSGTGLVVTAAELANLTATAVVLQTTGAGQLNIAAADASATAGYTLTLRTTDTGNVVQTGTFQFGDAVFIDSAGAYTIDGSNMRALGGLTVDAVGGVTATGAVQFLTSASAITFNNGITISGLAGSVTIDATDNNNSATGGAIVLQGVDGTLADTNDLTLYSGQGATTVNGALTNLGTLTLHRNAADSTGSMTFHGAVTTGTLVTAPRAHELVFNAALTVTAATTFNNSGALTLGGGATHTFTNGVTATAPSSVTVAGGVIQSSDAAITLGDGDTDVVLAGNTTISSGTGAISLGAVTVSGGDRDLILQGSGGATIASANLGATTGTLDLSGVTGGTVTVAGDLTAASITTAATPYNIALLGGGAVTNAVAFSNTGTLTIGDDASDVFTFTGGVAATVPVTLGGTVATVGEAISFGAVTLGADTVLDTGAGAGDITVTGTVTGGGNALTLAAGTGSIDLQDAVSGLASITVNSATAARFGANVTTTGIQSVTATIIRTNGTHQTTDSAITFTGTTELQAATELNTGAGAGDISVGDVTGNFALTLDAGTGNVTAGVINTSGTDGGAVTLTGNTLSVTEINTNGGTGTGGDITFNNVAALTLPTIDAGGDTSGANLTFNGPVLLGAATSITTGVAGGDITFNGTVNGGFSLDLTAGIGAVSFNGVVGGDTPIGALTVSANTITVGAAITTAGAAVGFSASRSILVTGDIVTGGGDIVLTAQGLVTGENYAGIEINGATLDAGTGAIALTGTGGDDGSANDGIRLIGGAVVQTSGTGTITIVGTGGAGTTENNGVFMADFGTRVTAEHGDIEITGSVAGAGGGNGVRIRSSARVSTTGSGDIRIDGTGGAGAGDNNAGVVVLDSSTWVHSTDGNIEITGQGGGPGQFNHGIVISNGRVFSTAAGGITLTGTGAAGSNHNAGVVISGSVAQVTTVDGGITIVGTGGAATGANNDGIRIQAGALVASTGLGDLALSGTAVTDDAGILIDGSTVSTGAGTLTIESANDGTTDSIRLSGATEVSGSGALVLRPIGVGTAIAIGDGTGVTAGFILDATELALIQDGFASITIGRADGAHAVTIGSASFSDPVTIRTGSAGGEITFVAGTTLIATGNASVTLSSVGDIHFDTATIDTRGAGAAGDVTITSDARLRTPGSGSSILTDGGDVVIAADILLQNALTIDTEDGDDSAAGSVTITGNVAGDGGTNDIFVIDASGAVAGDVTVTGTIGLGGVAGGTNVYRVSISGGTVEVNDIRATSVAGDPARIELTGTAIVLSGTAYSIDGAGAGAELITFNGPVTLSGATTVTGATGAGDIVTFNGSVTGPHALVVNGLVHLGGDVTTVGGTQTYSNAVVLDASVTLTGSTITFGGTVNSSGDGTTSDGNSLAIVGDAVFNSFVGNATDGTLGSVTVSLTTAIGGNVRTSGVQTYNGAVTLNGAGGDRTLTGSVITFGATVNSSGDGGTTSDGNGVWIAGQAVFNGAVGNNADGALGRLVVQQLATLNGGTIAALGDVTLQGAVTLGADTTIDAGGFITFGSTVDRDGTARSLTLTAGSNIGLNGVIGGGINGPLGAFTVIAAPQLSVNTTAINVASFDSAAPVVVMQDVAITASGAITFQGTLNGNRAVTLDGATVTFGGTVGNATALTSLAVTGPATVNTTLVRTSGDQTWNDNVTVGANLQLESTAGVVAFGGAVAGNAGTESLTVTGDTVLAANGNFSNLANLTLDGMVNGDVAGRTLAISASGIVTITGAAGGTNVLGAFTIDDAAEAHVNAVTVNGGMIRIGTAGTPVPVITASGTLTTQGAAGGELILSGGGITVSGISVGATNIELYGDGLDIIVGSAITSPGAITITALRDVVVEALIRTTTGGITLTADSDSNGDGGVVIAATGGLDSADTISVTSAEFTNGGGTLGYGAYVGESIRTEAGSTIDATGAISLTAATGSVVLGSTIVTPSTLTIISGDSISQTNGALNIGTLTGSAVANASFLMAANAIDNLGAFTTGGASGFYLLSTGDLAITGDVTTQVSGPLSITTDAGNLSVTTGSITGLQVALRTTTSGNIVLAGDVSGAGTMTLQSVGSISQIGGTLTAAANLTGSAATTVSLTQATNAITTLGEFSANGGFTLVDTGGLTINGAVSDAAGLVSITTDGGDLTITTDGFLNIGSVTGTGVTLVTTTSGNIVLGNDVNGGAATVTLTSAGSIDQTGGTLTAATLTGSAAATTVLTQATNAITNLGAFSSVGGFTLVDTGGLTLTGNVSDATGTVSLTTTGAIAQTGGIVTALTLTGSATGAVTLGQTNAITNLGAFTSNGAFTLVDAGGLNVTGAVTTTNNGLASITTDAGDLAITTGSVAGDGVALTTTTSGDIALGGNVNAGGGAGDVTLVAAGSITQSAGAIAASLGRLTGSAGGTVSLTSASNSAWLGTFTSDGGFTYVTAGGLVVDGNVTDASGQVSLTTDSGGIWIEPTFTVTGVGVSLTTTTAGDITLAGDVDAGAGTLTLISAGLIDQTGGTLTAGTLTGSAASTASIAQATNAFTNLGAFTTNGAFTLVDTGGLNVTGVVTTTNNGLTSITTDAGNLAVTTGSVAGAGVTLVTTTSGDIALAGDVNGNAGTVTLTSAGAISRTAGTVTGATVALGAATGIGADGAPIDTAATNISAATTNGEIFIANTLATAVTVTGLTTGSGAISFVQSGGGSLTIGGAGVTSGGGDITLTNSLGSGGLSIAADVDSSPGAGGTLSIGGGVTIGGAITVGAGTVTLDGGGQDIVVDTPIIVATPITLTAPRDVVVNALVQTSAGDITLIADSNSDGDGGVAITDNGAVDAFGDLIVSGSNFTNLGGGGAFATYGGYGVSIHADLVAGGDQTFSGTARIHGDPTLTVGGAVTFNDAVSGDSNVENLVIAGNAVFNDLVSNLGSLQVNSTAALNGNVTTSGTQTYTGQVTLLNGLTLQGSTVTFGNGIAGANNALTITGNLALTGNAVDLTTLSVSGTSTLAGNVTSSGTQTYTNLVTLSGDRTLQGSTVSFGNGIAGANNALTITGNLALTGNAVDLTTLSVSGTSTLAGNVTSSGTQTYTGEVTLASADRTLTATTVTMTDGLVGAGFSLDVSNDFVLGAAAIGLNALTVGGSTALGADVTATTQAYTGLVTLSGGARTLTGAVTFSAGATGTAALTVDGTATLGGDVDTGAGDQTYTGLVTLAGADRTLTGGTINLQGGVDGQTAFGLAVVGDLALTGNAVDLTFLTVSGASNLGGNVTATTQAYTGLVTLSGGARTLTGAVTFSAGATGTADLTVDGTATLGGDVNTGAGNQTYTGLITLSGANRTLTAGTVNLQSGVAGAGFGLTITGNFDLDADATGLSALSVSGASNLGANVTAGGTQTYTGAVTVSGAAVTLDATAVTFGATVAGDIGTETLLVDAAAVFGGNVSNLATLEVTGTTTIGTTLTIDVDNALFRSTVSGSGTEDLTIIAATTFDAAVFDLNALTVDGTLAANGGSVTTAGAQAYTGAVTLGADLVLTTTDSDISFGSTVDSALATNHTLVLTAGTGTVTIVGATGGTQPLGGFNVTSAAAVSLASVTVDGTVTGEGIIIGAPGSPVATIDVVGDLETLGPTGGALILAGGGISITGNVTVGETNIALYGDGDDVIISTGVLVINDFSIAASRDIIISATVQSTGGSIELTAGIGGDGGVLVTATGSLDAAGNLTITGISFTNEGGTGDPANATYIGNAVTILGNAVAGGTATFTSTAGNDIVLGADVSSIGLQTYNGPVVLSAPVTLAASTVHFTGTLAGGANALAITGDLDLDGAATGLDTLTVSGASNLGADVSSSGNQSYGGLVTLSGGDRTLTSTGGAVSFGDGLAGGSAALTVDGNLMLVGDASDLTTLSVSGTSNLGGDVTTSGAQSYTGQVTLSGADRALDATTVTMTGGLVGGGLILAVSNDFVLGADATGLNALMVGGLSTLGGDITSTGAQTYTGQVTLAGADRTLDATTVTMTGGLVGGGFSLDVSNDFVLGAAATALNHLSVAGDAQLAGNVTTTGNQSYAGAVTLTGARTLASGGDLLFGGTVTGADLTVANAINVSFGDTVTLTGAFVQTDGAGTTTFAGNLTATQVDILTDAVVLGAGVALDTSGANGNITIIADDLTFGAGAQLDAGTGTVLFAPRTTGNSLEICDGVTHGCANTEDSTYDLGTLSVITAGAFTIGRTAHTGDILVSQLSPSFGLTVVNGGTGGITVGGPFDGASFINLTSGSGGIALNADVTAATTHTYNGAVTLTGAPRTLTGDTITFNGAVSGTALTVDGAVVINGGSVNTAGAQVYLGTVALGAATTLTATTTTFSDAVSGVSLEVNGAVAINGGSVNTTGAQVYNNAVTLGTATVLTASATTFNGAVSGNALTVNGPVAINGGTVNTAGFNQQYNGMVTLGAATTVTAATATFNGGITGGGNALTVDGNFALNNVAATGVGSLTANAISHIGASITTTGAQDYNGTVLLTGNAVLTAGGDITFADTVNGGFALATNAAATRFTAAVGSGTALASIAVTGPAFIDGGVVTTTGTQAWNGAVTLGVGTTFNGSMVTFGSAVTGPSLVVNGATTLGGNVTTATTQTYNGTVALSGDSTLTATMVRFNGTVSGAGNNLSIPNALELNASIAGLGAITVGGATTLFTDASVAGSGTLSFAAIDGASTLSLSGGAVVLNGAVGGGTPLTSLTVTGPATLVNGNVTATGTVSFGSAVTANGALTVNAAVAAFASSVTSSGAQTFNAGTTQTNGVHTSNGGNITLGGQLEVQSATTLNAGAGTIALRGVSGGTTLELVSSGGAVFNGQMTVDTLGMSGLTGGVTLGGDTTITTAGTVIDLSAASGINGAHALTLNAGTSRAILPTVGATTPLGALTINSSGADELRGDVNAASVTTNTGGSTLIFGNVTTSGAQTYNDVVILAGAAGTRTLTGSTVTFASTVDAASAGTQGLAVIGPAVFAAAVGGSTPLASLSVSGTSTIPDGVTTTGSQTYGGAATIDGDFTGDSIAFNDAVIVGAASVVLMTSDTLDFNGGAGSVSGTGALTLVPATEDASIAIGGSGAVLNLSADAFGGFEGALTIGALGDEGPIVGGPITVNQQMTLGASSTLTLMANGSITLESGGLSAGTLILAAAGDGSSILNNGGAANVLRADFAMLIAANEVGAANLDLEIASLSGAQAVFEVQVGAGVTQANISPSTTAVTRVGRLAPDSQELASKLGIQVAVDASVTSAAQASASREQSGGLAESGSIDASLFEDISLYAIERGVRLPRDQMEDEEDAEYYGPAEVDCDAVIAQALTEGGLAIVGGACAENP